MAKLERRLIRSSPEREPYFLRFAKNYTSQGGEDGILEELFRMLYDNKFSGSGFHCVEIGAWDGIHLSNTYHLLHDLGWSGILVEAEPERCASLSNLYSQHPTVHCVNALVDIEGPNSLNSLLEKYNCPKEPNFISIDIDGADYHLWKSIGSNFRAHIVCIEFNPSIPNSIYFIQTSNVKIQQGSSLLALVELGKELGYEIVSTTTFNAIFVRKDLFYQHLPTHEINQDINHLHIPFMATEMFQTYDGELKFVGTKKLLWHKLSMNPQQLQILPKKDRKYPFAPDAFVHIQQLNAHALKISRFFIEMNVRGSGNDATQQAQAMNDLKIHVNKFLDMLTLTYISGNGFQVLQGVLFQLWSNESLLWNQSQLEGLLYIALQLHRYAGSKTTEEVLQSVQYDQLAYVVVDKILHMQHEAFAAFANQLFACEILAIDIQLSIARYHFLLQQYLQAMQELSLVHAHLMIFEHHADTAEGEEEKEVVWNDCPLPSIGTLFQAYEKLQRKCIMQLRLDPSLQMEMLLVEEEESTSPTTASEGGDFNSPYAFADSIKVRKTSQGAVSMMKKRRQMKDIQSKSQVSRNSSWVVWAGGIGAVSALAGIAVMYFGQKDGK